MKKKILIVVGILAVFWTGMGIIDCSRVHRFEKPFFCIIKDGGYDDGGSGTYIGLGYSFDIEGNFMPEDELPGVTEYTIKVFGTTISNGIRD